MLVVDPGYILLLLLLLLLLPSWALNVAGRLPYSVVEFATTERAGPPHVPLRGPSQGYPKRSSSQASAWWRGEGTVVPGHSGPAAEVGAESARPCLEGGTLGAPQGGSC